MKLMKSYGIFCSRSARFLFFLTAVWLLVQQDLLLAFGHRNFMLPTCGILAVIEISADHWVFGGTCAKGAQGMDYLMSSARGKRVLGYALKGDCLMRLLMDIVVLGGGAVLAAAHGAADPAGILLGTAGMIAATYGVVTLTLVISRHWTILGYSLSAASAGCMVLMGLLLLQGYFPWIGLLSAVLCVPITLLAVKRVLDRMEAGFHDGMEF